MTYELAKQLKEARFPLERVKNNGALSYYQDREAFTADPDFAYLVPTLSELIEACGDKFYRLERNTSPAIPVWQAWGRDDKAGSPGLMTHENGPTPEEAVANLYLALNSRQ